MVILLCSLLFCSFFWKDVYKADHLGLGQICFWLYVVKQCDVFAFFSGCQSHRRFDRRLGGGSIQHMASKGGSQRPEEEKAKRNMPGIPYFLFLFAYEYRFLRLRSALRPDRRKEANKRHFPLTPPVRRKACAFFFLPAIVCILQLALSFFQVLASRAQNGQRSIQPRVDVTADGRPNRKAQPATFSLPAGSTPRPNAMQNEASVDGGRVRSHCQSREV